MIVHDFPGAAEGDLRSSDLTGIVNRHDAIGLERINAVTGARVPIADPPDRIRWPRLTPTGPVRVCGQAQHGSSFEWDGDETWTDSGPAHGASPTIYDGANVLHIIRPAADQTVNGYRCLDARGVPILGEATIAIATVPDGRLLHKFTPIETPDGTLLVGQDDEAGVHLVFQDRRYILDDGVVDFIRASWTAGRGLAVLVTHYPERLVRTFLLGLEEIATLPEFKPPVDPPDPIAPPKFTISWPVFPVAGVAPFALVCVYAVETGSGPVEWIEWLLGTSPAGPWTVSARNPGSDPDHTYRFPTAGTWYIKARGGNAAGIHETGLERKVTVRSPIPPIDPPVDPGSSVWLKTIWNDYLSTDAGGFLVRGPRKQAFQIQATATPGVVAITSGGKYAATENDLRVKVDRPSVGSEWEQFDLVTQDSVRRSFKSQRIGIGAGYISAHSDGPVMADKPDPLSWETFVLEPATGGGGGALSPLHVDQWQFRDATGAAVRIRGFSGFKLLRMLADGQRAEVDPILQFFTGHGANAVRVWPYVTWPGTGWETPSNGQILEGIRYLESWGLRSYLTLFTDSQPPEDSTQQNRIPWAKDLIGFLQGQTTALLVEIGNEPQINKRIDTGALRSTLEASGFLYTSGEYADSAQWFGRFGDAHTPRDIQWCRKAHDLHEYYVGGGPSYPEEPATKTVWIAGEPAKPSDEPNAPQTDPDTGVVISKVEDNLAYAATCGLLGGGGIFHYEGGKFGQLPVGEEVDCATAFFQGLRAFPEEMLPPSAYERIDEHGETLRTYKKGPYTVRIRPKSGPILITG